MIRRAELVFAPLGLPVQPRNQARVHLWLTGRFGESCPPLATARAGVARFLFPALRLAKELQG